MQYAVLLGREPLLSLAELEAVLALQDAENEIELRSDNIAVFTFAANPESIFTHLGGSIKLGKVLDHVPQDVFLRDPLKVLHNDEFKHKVFDKDTSGSFALNIHGDAPSGFGKKIKSLGIEWKKLLRQELDHVRYVESRDETTSSVTVKRNKLLRGCDLWILFSGDQVLLIKTIAVQDYRSFGERDFGRPARNARAGMLPPKLARILVNLSEAQDDAVLLDPFVGSGTVLQEAALMGITTLIGTDLEQRAIDETKANVSWIIKEENLSADLSLHKIGIEELSPKDMKDVTHIVAELDLGTPLTKTSEPKEAQEHAKEAGRLVDELIAFSQKLPNLRRLVCAVPFWPTSQANIYTPFDPPTKLNAPYDFSGHEELFVEEFSRRGGFLYRRPNQFVGREIFVFEKVGA